MDQRSHLLLLSYRLVQGRAKPRDLFHSMLWIHETWDEYPVDTEKLHFITWLSFCAAGDAFHEALVLSKKHSLWIGKPQVFHRPED
ncbi:hypothetical protein CDEST_06626 [Colletotrichum destructivum]|uniref:Uncharacterized protein n=1 Tax=Colletotrichum destructivum TaxID=34406 RepID=A0AAX4IE27_9PEZI|nr:hypothetical protein CDEST_06626 [Colletotrichum destructivum]